MPDVAQLVERSTVEFAGIEWSLVRFRASGAFQSFSSSFPRLRNSTFEIDAFRDSIVVSISACHADDPGSIPGRGEFSTMRSKQLD